MKNFVQTILAAILLIVIAICLYLILAKPMGTVRIVDMTEDKTYTLSQGTRNILNKLNQTITIKLYFTKTAARKGPEGIRYWNSYARYVQDLLNEYERLAKGKIKLQVIDPRPFSEEEEAAVEYGLKRFQLSESEGFIFGLVVLSEYGKSKIIEFFQPDRQQLVEYDISKIINDLMERDKKKIGIISSLPVMGSDMSPYMMQMLRMQNKQPEEPWTIIADLRNSYEVEKVEVNEKDPKIEVSAYDYLFVIHPTGFNQATLFAIDQYVMEGGRLVVFVDPFCLAGQRSSPFMMNPGEDKTSSSLNELLQKWGLSVSDKKIVLDPTYGQMASGGPRQSPERLIAWLLLNTPQNFNRHHPIASSLQQVQVCFAGKLTPQEVKDVTFIPLIQTSSIASTWEAEKYMLQFLSAETMREIRQKHIDGSSPIAIAGELRGKFLSNYPDGIEVEVESSSEKKDSNEDEPSSSENEKKDSQKPKEKKKIPPRATESKPDTRIIVFADVDMITNMFAYQETFFGSARRYDNAACIYNVLDYLGGSEDLIRIRTRKEVNRPFERFEAIKRETEKRTIAAISQLKNKIKEYEDQLRKLEGGSEEGAAAFIQSDVLEKRRKLQLEIQKANRELRKLQEEQRIALEEEESFYRSFNLYFTPLVLIIIGLIDWMIRYFIQPQKARLSKV